MRINYKDLTIKELLNLIEILPDYNFICDGDTKEIIIKEKNKDEKNR